MMVKQQPEPGSALDMVHALRAFDDTMDYLSGWRDVVRRDLISLMPAGQKTSTKIAPGFTVTVEWKYHEFCHHCHGYAVSCPRTRDGDLGVPTPGTYRVPYPRFVSITAS